MQREELPEQVVKRKGEKDAVKVMVRVRPFSSKELKHEDREDGADTPISVVSMDMNNNVDVVDMNGVVRDSFEYHKVYWSIPESQKQTHVNMPFSDQETIFQDTGAPAVESAVKGYHSCIFAYGQTGSGKTHTMLGSPQDKGVAPRVIYGLFEELKKQEALRKSSSTKFTVEISFMEIYNEKVKDLFDDEFLGGMKRRRSTRGGEDLTPDVSPTTLSKKKSRQSLGAARRNTGVVDDQGYAVLKVRQSPTVGTFIEGLKRIGPEQGVSTPEAVEQLMLQGMQHRSTAATAMNETSSRSHAIFQICLKARNGATGMQRYAHINLVDLAGSERVKMSGVEGERFMEATRINLSLSTLRRVIDALIENTQKKKGQPKVVPPYRDAMLTWILSESLGGNSKTMMIATVSPAESNREDTVNTLRYALKAKSIVNTIRINEQKVSVVVSAMMKEMQDLRSRLENEAASPEMQVQVEMQTELDQLEEEYSRMENETREMHTTRAHLESEVVIKEREMEEKHEEIAKLQIEERVEEKHLEEVELGKETETRLGAEKEKEKELESEHFERQLQLQSEAIEVEDIERRKMDMEMRREAYAKESAAVKRKQFAVAFQKAFAYTKSSSNKTTISEEVQDLNDKISALQICSEQTVQKHRQYEAENSIFEERILRIERQSQDIQHRRAADEDRAQRTVRIVQAEKKVEEEHLSNIRAMYMFEQNTLLLQQETIAKERHIIQGRLRNTTTRLQSCKTEKITKQRLLQQLHQQASVYREEISHLLEENAALHETVTSERDATSRLSKMAAELRVCNKDLRADLDVLYDKTQKVSGDTTSLNIQFASLVHELEEIGNDHEDLRKFVSVRFFPNSSGQSLNASYFEAQKIREYSLSPQRGGGGQSPRGGGDVSPRVSGVSPRGGISPRVSGISPRPNMRSGGISPRPNFVSPKANSSANIFSPGPAGPVYLTSPHTPRDSAVGMSGGHRTTTPVSVNRMMQRAHTHQPDRSARALY